MGRVIHINKDDIKSISDEEIKELWDKWSGDPCDLIGNYEHEDIYFEMNRRGLGKYCSV